MMANIWNSVCLVGEVYVHNKIPINGHLQSLGDFQIACMKLESILYKIEWKFYIEKFNLEFFPLMIKIFPDQFSISIEN